MKKVQGRLIREMEKKLSKRHVIFTVCDSVVCAFNNATFSKSLDSRCQGSLFFRRSHSIQSFSVFNVSFEKRSETKTLGSRGNFEQNKMTPRSREEYRVETFYSRQYGSLFEQVVEKPIELFCEPEFA